MYLSTNVIQAVITESERAHDKHKDIGAGQSIFDPKMPILGKLAALMEEVGEVARAIIEGEPTENLYKELVQSANVALTWADSLPK